jgi:hypothetical protein
MRRSNFCVSLLTVALSLAGCSGLNDLKHSGGGTGGGTQTGSITVAPTTATVSIFGTQTFTATVTGTSNTAVTWQVNGVTGGSKTTGYVSSSGAYVAPSGVPTASDGSGDVAVTSVTVTAISKANSGLTASAIVKVTSLNKNAQSGAIKLGTSGGNVNDTNNGMCCGGTLGSLVTKNGTNYILSNNHVLAKSDSAIAGDHISQPGIIDSADTCTTTGTSTVANLSEFFNLETGPNPKVDAALAQIVNGQVDTSGNILLLGATQTGGVPDPGAPHAGSGVAATVGQAVAKSGRTTGLTCSTILATSVLANVDYYRHCGDTTKAFTASYTNLVSVAGGHFSAGGDSGSLIVSQSTADPVALLSGGSDTDSVGNPMSDVLAAFPGTGNVLPTFVGGAAHQVIGCTLPTVPQSAVAQQAEVATETMQSASLVRDMHAPELLANTGIHAIGLGKSYDHPGQAAILLFTSGKSAQRAIPQSLDGVSTRVIEGAAWWYRGMLSNTETAQMLQGVAAPQLVYELRGGEMERAKAVHEAHAVELLKNENVLGVGISSSVDSPGEAALLIYVKRGASQNALPAQIDGLRTRIRETSAFEAGRDSDRGNASRGCKVKSALPTPVNSAKL